MKTSTNNIGIGSYVEDNIHGLKGRIYGVHYYVELPEDQQWVDMQVPPIEEEAMEFNYLWYSVLTHGGGAILRPAYALDEIEEFDLQNVWVDKYWPSSL